MVYRVSTEKCLWRCIFGHMELPRSGHAIFFWTSENAVGTSASKNNKTDTKNYFSERNYWAPLGDAPICFV
jgi:hypothetical protein